jgi:hypothetical protein
MGRAGGGRGSISRKISRVRVARCVWASRYIADVDWSLGGGANCTTQLVVVGGRRWAHRCSLVGRLAAMKRKRSWVEPCPQGWLSIQWRTLVYIARGLPQRCNVPGLIGPGILPPKLFDGHVGCVSVRCELVFVGWKLCPRGHCFPGGVCWLWPSRAWILLVGEGPLIFS